MPEAGDLIGPYRVISQLGRGAMGEVWRARDERLDRYVALKILPADAAGDAERRARMLREARAAAAIRHANVVTLFDIVSHGGEDILVMELVEGRTLSEALRKDGAPPLATALTWIEGVTDALVAAHARGVLHRDIKAANIMVSGDTIKVLDFGLAKLRHDGDLVASVSLRPRPSASSTRLALDETMASGPPASERPAGESPVGSQAPSAGDAPLVPSAADPELARTQPDRADAGAGAGAGAAAGYQTHDGQLLGTPLYMAPEQIQGALPDERSEVFSVGVLAHEILGGKPPYTATSIDELFEQITSAEPPALPEVPDGVQGIVRRALAKDPGARWPSMQAFGDAIKTERRRRFAPRARRWPLVVAAALLSVGAALGVWWWRAHQPAAAQPGDDYVQRALDEFDVFYNDKAMSSLRAAVRVAPDHPTANAYILLFGFASDADRAAALAAAYRALPATAAHSRDRVLLDTAIALTERGVAAAAAVLDAHAGTARDRELAFWKAELDYAAGRYAEAGQGYQRLLADKSPRLRGRIYDHYSSVLLYTDDTAEALRIGTLYRDAFPGEADAIGVYATTLSAAGDHAASIAAAEEALRLAEGEDTLAGLAKVLAIAGDRARARELYQRSLERAGGGRRPVRRAALGLLQWLDSDATAAAATVAPCLPGGADAAARERGACLFVAGVIDPAVSELAATELDRLAAEASELRPSYGEPAALAMLVRARARFFGGACLVAAPAMDPGRADEALYAARLDFYAAYHVPFFATWALCERAAVRAARGDRAGAAAVLAPMLARAPHRTWIRAAADRYR